MTVTRSGPRLSRMRRTTVVLPEPEPPATPMTSGGANSVTDGEFRDWPASDTIFHEFSGRREPPRRDMEEYQESGIEPQPPISTGVRRAIGRGVPFHPARNALRGRAVHSADRVVGVALSNAESRGGPRAGARGSEVHGPAPVRADRAARKPG